MSADLRLFFGGRQLTSSSFRNPALDPVREPRFAAQAYLPNVRSAAIEEAFDSPVLALFAFIVLFQF